jgi:DNA primase
MPANDQIWNQIRDACDIVDIVGEHIALKRAGREFKGLCPFHDDRRPSMSVVPHKQIFHCFVCGTGGDVFKFIELFHKMSKGEALRFLSQKTGIKLPELEGRNAQRSAEKKSARESVFDANSRACGFFEKTLMTDAGKHGLGYLRSRGLTDETIKAFRLGMSPDNWTALCDSAARLGISPENLVQSGLAKKRSDGSLYDAFRNRVIFPIIDATGASAGASGKSNAVSGRVIAFGGRVLEERRDEAGNVVEAKYLNSPETAVFVKSASLYGLDRARQAIIRTQTAVVVEGYMDVIACHQAGVTNVVATLGTALTPEHAKILKRFCNTVVLIFDSDDAGFRAAERAMQTFVREPIDVKIASVPDGKDPCDFCISRGAEGGPAFQKVIDSAVDMLDYQWLRLQKQFKANTGISARAEAAKEFMRFVAQGLEVSGRDMDPVRRGMLMSKIGNLVGMSVEETSHTLRTLVTDAAPRVMPDADREIEEAQSPAAPFNASSLLGLDAAEAWVLGSLLAEPALYATVRDDIALSLFSPACLQPLAHKLLEYFEDTHELSACSIADFISTIEETTLVNQAIQLEELSSAWLIAAEISPALQKVVKSQQADMGRSNSRKLVDCLHELIKARGNPAEETAPASADDESAALARMLERAKDRNNKGGDRRIMGRSK